MDRGLGLSGDVLRLLRQDIEELTQTARERLRLRNLSSVDARLGGMITAYEEVLYLIWRRTKDAGASALTGSALLETGEWGTRHGKWDRGPGSSGRRADGDPWEGRVHLRAV